MAGDERALSGPDFSKGFPLVDLQDGIPVLGHRDGEPVLLVALGGEVSAVGAVCTHYGGPLEDGLMVNGTVLCPWHHACFSLRTGEALSAPALSPLPRWEVEVREGRVFVGRKREEDPLSPRGRAVAGPGRVVILGAGAAGSAAAEQLRREGHQGEVVLVDPDVEAPYDRPNLSKDYLAGSAPEEWIPLRPAGFHEARGIRRIVDRAVRLDTRSGRLKLESSGALDYDALLIATGATPRKLDVPGADLRHVFTLRTLADCRAIIGRASEARRAVVAGASFIGMEVAASLRARGLAVTVVAPEEVPFARSLGPELGALFWRAHEENGVEFRLGQTIAGVERTSVVLDDESGIPADIVVVGIGVDPDTALARAAGLAVDDGVMVDGFLRTADPRIFAAGDVARWPDPRSGRPVRIEHWVVAQRQGQTAARNILGRNERYTDVPFFWTRQFDLGVSYIGHGAGYDRVEEDPDPTGPGVAFRYFRGDHLLALATIGWDRLSLETEVALAAGTGGAAEGRGP